MWFDVMPASALSMRAKVPIWLNVCTGEGFLSTLSILSVAIQLHVCNVYPTWTARHIEVVMTSSWPGIVTLVTNSKVNIGISCFPHHADNNPVKMQISAMGFQLPQKVLMVTCERFSEVRARSLIQSLVLQHTLIVFLVCVCVYFFLE